MHLFRKRKDEEYSFRYIVTVFSVICLLLGVGCYAYYTQIQETIKEENEHYLDEISTRIANNISSTIDNNFAILKTLTSFLSDYNVTTFAEVGPILKQQIEYWPFDNLLLIDTSGIAYDANMAKVSITGDSFLRSLSNEEPAIFTSQVINNQDRLIFTMPTQNVTLDGKQIIALATSYNPEELDEILSMESFDSQSYSQVVTYKGATAIRSNSDIADEFGYNIINSIELMDPSGSSQIEKMRTDMEHDKNGQCEFMINGTYQYLVYTNITSLPWYLFTFVPVSIVSEKSNLLLQSTLVISLFIVVVFASLITVLVLSFRKHRRKLERIAYVDAITEGPTIQHFFEFAKHGIGNHPDSTAVLFTNIQRFKVLNDQLGRLVCDEILIIMQQAIQMDLQDDESLGHYTADNFVVAISFENKDEIMERLVRWHLNMKEIAAAKAFNLPTFALTYGIYIVEDKDMETVDMIDRARVALRESKDMVAYNDNLYYSFYDDEVRHRMIREKYLEDRMDQALRENEFQMYLQPKYAIREDKVAGAEALVRWQSKSEGMIFPDSFIPLFERNGFIIKLDLWMFEQVCILIKKWLDQERTPIKISVNCSRVHLKDENFLDAYYKIFKKYQIPANYIELELTENVVFENTEHLAKVIDDIHALGFGCSMDDFGSGYSSLNLLQNIHVDTLKLDRIFFRNEFEKKPRNKAIIDCILQMAQSLSMATVAEGVEDEEQVDVLRVLGCDYIQGYVYAKPMPIPEFEALLFQNRDKKGEK